ncbi:hypothetical protein Sme01_16960 [Sphaerisporangium melleum]|uniref:Uncharacterized protein n=1 Tax=Sphaerisporangium melleum TaxID=321316 RepID=A0A917VHG6_9ACTN|nr:hypothetical protein GCM10007964_26900 [Sphaerisporangium melleum]GII69220.1 hypothetical protein Sme01_16960 [Sphaerisporangium melleum]
MKDAVASMADRLLNMVVTRETATADDDCTYTLVSSCHATFACGWGWEERWKVCCVDASGYLCSTYDSCC